MELDFAYIATDLSVALDGRVTVTAPGVDLIVTPAVPAVHPQLVVMVRALLTADEAQDHHPLRVSFRSPSGAELGAWDFQTPIVPENVQKVAADLPAFGAGVIQNIQNLPLPEYGAYAFTVELSGHPVKTMSLAVIPPVAEPLADDPPAPG